MPAIRRIIDVIGFPGQREPEGEGVLVDDVYRFRRGGTGNGCDVHWAWEPAGEVDGATHGPRRVVDPVGHVGVWGWRGGIADGHVPVVNAGTKHAVGVAGPVPAGDHFAVAVLGLHARHRRVDDLPAAFAHQSPSSPRGAARHGFAGIAAGNLTGRRLVVGDLEVGGDPAGVPYPP